MLAATTASGRSAFGSAVAQARPSAAVVGPAPYLPRRAGAIAPRHALAGLAPVVTAVEPQARVRRACVRAAPHVADGACCASAGGVECPPAVDWSDGGVGANEGVRAGSGAQKQQVGRVDQDGRRWMFLF